MPISCKITSKKSFPSTATLASFVIGTCEYLWILPVHSVRSWNVQVCGVYFIADNFTKILVSEISVKSGIGPPLS